VPGDRGGHPVCLTGLDRRSLRSVRRCVVARSASARPRCIGCERVDSRVASRQPLSAAGGHRAPLRRMRPRIAILGAGSWGSALAVHLTRTGHDVQLWARSANLAAEMIATRQNARYLTGVTLPDRVSPTHSLDEALAGAEVVVVTVPSHGLRVVIRDARPAVEAGAIVVSAVKGLEVASMRRMSEVICEELHGVS